MNEVTIKKYTELLNTFERIILNTKVDELRESAKESYTIFIRYLAQLEKKEITIYEESLRRLNISDTKIKETINDIEKSIGNQKEQDLKAEGKEVPAVDEEKNIIPESSGKVEKGEDSSLVDNTEKNKDAEVEEPITEEPKVEIEEKPLKILNIKKSFKSKNDLASLKVPALVGIGGMALGVPPILALPVAAIVWKLNKNKGLTNSKLKSCLNKTGYTINDETKELIDGNGEVVTTEKIKKSKFEMLKQYLINLSNSKKDGKIKTEYKKNRMASKLLNRDLVEKLKIFKKKEVSDEQTLDENQVMQKGMGKC